MSIREKLLARQPPPLLYQYTGQDGLLGIINSEQLWATQVEYLHDSTEFFWALENVVAQGPARYGDDPIMAPVLKAADDMLRYRGTAHFRVFIACLTEKPDLLSQWRAYCAPGDGFSVGFDSAALRDAATRQEWVLAPVVYNPGEHEVLTTELLSKVRTECEAKINAQEPGWSDESCAVLFRENLSVYAPLMKHPAFEEEQEWRLISPPVPPGDGAVCYRRGRHSLIPYVKFQLADSSASLHLPEVCVGPGSQVSLTMNALSNLTADSGRRPDSGRRVIKGIRRSSVADAYRDW